MDRGAVDEINAHIDQVMGELRQDIQDLASKVDALGNEMHEAFEAFRQDMRSTLRELAGDASSATDD